MITPTAHVYVRPAYVTRHLFFFRIFFPTPSPVIDHPAARLPQQVDADDDQLPASARWRNDGRLPVRRRSSGPSPGFYDACCETPKALCSLITSIVRRGHPRTLPSLSFCRIVQHPLTPSPLHLSHHPQRFLLRFVCLHSSVLPPFSHLFLSLAAHTHILFLPSSRFLHHPQYDYFTVSSASVVWFASLLLSVALSLSLLPSLSLPVASCSTLYSQGGIGRFYRGVGPALIQGPMSRFGDTAANTGILALMDSYDSTKGLPVGAKTLCASVAAALWRIFLMP